MVIPKWEAAIALILSAALILGAAQIITPPTVVYAQATTCAESSTVDPAKLAITVAYQPNAAAFPPEQAVEVQRNLNNGPWTNLPNLPANTRSFVDNSVVQGTVDHTYNYRVRVINADGPSSWSAVGCKTIRRQKMPPPTPELVVS